MADKVLMKGNEAIAEAAIIAGCRHYFGYPITPQTEIAAYMAKKMPKIGSEVVTPDGKAIVVSNNMLKLIVRVKIPNSDGSFAYKDFNLADVKVKKANKIEDADAASQEELKEIKDLLD